MLMGEWLTLKEGSYSFWELDQSRLSISFTICKQVYKTKEKHFIKGAVCILGQVAEWIESSDADALG